MKPRARRVTILAALLGAGVVGVLVIINWGMVRDHVEGWCFQLTRTTETITPKPLDMRGLTVDEALLRYAAELRHPVIVDPAELSEASIRMLRRTENPKAFLAQWRAFRVIDQRFPTRAYVAIRAIK